MIETLIIICITYIFWIVVSEKKNNINDNINDMSYYVTFVFIGNNIINNTA